MLLNFKEAFTFMFKDEKFWQKYAIGTLLSILPFVTMTLCIVQYNKLGTNPSINEILSILGTILIMSLGCIIIFFCIGYCVNYANAKVTTGINELPEWRGNFKTHFIEGIKLWAGMMLIGVCVSAVVTVLQIILGIIGGIVGIAIGLSGSSKTLLAIAVVVLFFLVLIIFAIVSFIFLIYIYLAISSFIVDKNVLAVFNFKRIRALSKKNLLNLFLIFLVFIPVVIFSLIIFISPILYSLIMIIFNFYIMLVFYNLLAQYVQIGTKKNQERLEAKKIQENN